MTNEVKVVEVPMFVKRGKHELAGLLKQIEGASHEAVDLLINTMNEEDKEKVSLKQRLECAQTLIDLQVRISTEISRDQLTRQIAEFKTKNLSGSFKTPEAIEDKPKAPRLDFSKIREV